MNLTSKKILIPTGILATIGLSWLALRSVQKKLVEYILTLWYLEAKKAGKVEDFDREALRTLLSQLTVRDLLRLKNRTERAIRSGSHEAPKRLIEMINTGHIQPITIQPHQINSYVHTH